VYSPAQKAPYQDMGPHQSLPKKKKHAPKKNVWTTRPKIKYITPAPAFSSLEFADTTDATIVVNEFE
jgi:hypothetical protein